MVSIYIVVLANLLLVLDYAHRGGFDEIFQVDAEEMKQNKKKSMRYLVAVRYMAQT